MDTTSFLFYCMIATFTPGPTNIMILSTVKNAGARQAMTFSYGATIGFGLLLVVSAALNSMLMAVMPKVITILQIIGSAYMVYLAYKIVSNHSSQATAEQTATFRFGVLLQFLNPKTVLFALTVIPAFIIPSYSGFAAVSVHIAAITLIGFSAFLTWVLFGSVLRTFLQKHQKFANLVMALFLAYAAVMIWT
ncbi:LysE family translocator [Paenibacillus glycanilyticus]|uniref:Amino acid transporter LysE n=1 Tax=Paenibacillus glycanilyticus TaxID=126569 RepID=A0ABQ6G8W5_9BACL|nr:LysE family transporter [Paenibacillus glycanilyticus]GLX66710.1 amino acid transporter LysE [Paenibacillus glycanilyticus]